MSNTQTSANMNRVEIVSSDRNGTDQQTANNTSSRNINPNASWSYNEPLHGLVFLIVPDLISMIKTVTPRLEA